MTSKYEVGYRKPPATGRFQKGQSGAPQGREEISKRISLRNCTIASPSPSAAAGRPSPSNKGFSNG